MLLGLAVWGVEMLRGQTARESRRTASDGLLDQAARP